MKIRWVVATSLVLLLASTLPASAQMMGSPPLALDYEAPWISFALGHARELELTADQVKDLTALRDEFQKEAMRLTGETRDAEGELRLLYNRKPLDLQAVEAKIRAIAALGADLRLGRVRTLEKAFVLLAPAQQQKLSGIAQSMGWMRGASMMGGLPEVTR